MSPHRTRRLILAVALVVAGTATAEPPVDHWAWQRPSRPDVPAVSGLPIANPIDALVRGRLTAAGLSPAPPATREQLVRRATYDLTGLPPTPDEVDAFVHDPSPDAWERVVDRLLASPR